MFSPLSLVKPPVYADVPGMAKSYQLHDSDPSYQRDINSANTSRQVAPFLKLSSYVLSSHLLGSHTERQHFCTNTTITAYIFMHSITRPSSLHPHA